MKTMPWLPLWTHHLCEPTTQFASDPPGRGRLRLATLVCLICLLGIGVWGPVSGDGGWLIACVIAALPLCYGLLCTPEEPHLASAFGSRLCDWMRLLALTSPRESASGARERACKLLHSSTAAA